MRLLLIPLALLTLAIYWPGLHGPFVYDDWHHVANNELVVGDSPISLHLVKGRPLELGSYRANYRLSGTNTFGFHIVNLGFHIVNGLLLFELAQELGLSAAWSLFATAVFWLHPLASEAVFYISGRSELMATMGILGSGIAFSRKRYVLAVLYALFGILSKEIALMIPILWLFLVERYRWSIPLWMKALPALCFAGVVVVDSNQILEALRANITSAPVEAYAVLALLSRVIWPVGLTIDHDFYHVSQFCYIPAFLLMALWPIVAWRYRTHTAGFANLWIWALLVPHLFVEPAGYLAEHHFYGPFAGISLLLAVVVKHFTGGCENFTPPIKPVHLGEEYV